VHLHRGKEKCIELADDFTLLEQSRPPLFGALSLSYSHEYYLKAKSISSANERQNTQIKAKVLYRVQCAAGAFLSVLIRALIRTPTSRSYPDTQRKKYSGLTIQVKN